MEHMKIPILLILLLGLHYCELKQMTSPDSEMPGKKLFVEFEIFGKVQGVFFRKNTVLEGKKLNLRGWCMNTPRGTVKGVMEGDSEKIKEMKHWLSKVGSKMSKIEKAEFRNERVIDKYTYSDFSVHYD